MPSWLTVIGHAKDSLWSIDLFRCESIMLRTHWVLDQEVKIGDIVDPLAARFETQRGGEERVPCRVAAAL